MRNMRRLSRQRVTHLRNIGRTRHRWVWRNLFLSEVNTLHTLLWVSPMPMPWRIANGQANDFPQKPSGRLQHAVDSSIRITLGGTNLLTTTRTVSAFGEKTDGIGPPPSEVSLQTDMSYMTWRGMCLNGVPTGTHRILTNTVNIRTRKDLKQDGRESYGAVRGVITFSVSIRCGARIDFMRTPKRGPSPSVSDVRQRQRLKTFTEVAPIDCVPLQFLETD